MFGSEHLQISSRSSQQRKKILSWIINTTTNSYYQLNAYYIAGLMLPMVQMLLNLIFSTTK